MTRIESLTQEQQDMIPVIRDEWIAHGLSTEPADRPAAEEGVREAYRTVNLEPPKYMLWLDSPLAGALGAWQLTSAWEQISRLLEGDTSVSKAAKRSRAKDPLRNAAKGIPLPDQSVEVWRALSPQLRAYATQDIDETVWNQAWETIGATTWAAEPKARDHIVEQIRRAIWGQHESGWLSFYDFFRRACNLELCNQLIGLSNVAKSAGWWWAMRGIAILTERPRELHRDPQNRLHNATGPALMYPDGFGIWSWHGVRVPRNLIEGNMTASDILRESNAEIRRCAIEHMGWDRFVTEAKLRQVGDEVPDPGNPGHFLSLYDVPEQIYDEPVRVLLCDNATPERDGTRRRFGLTVPADVPHALAAAAWTFGLTTEQYATTEHAY